MRKLVTVAALLICTPCVAAKFRAQGVIFEGRTIHRWNITTQEDQDITNRRLLYEGWGWKPNPKHGRYHANSFVDTLRQMHRAEGASNREMMELEFGSRRTSK